MGFVMQQLKKSIIYLLAKAWDQKTGWTANGNIEAAWSIINNLGFTYNEGGYLYALGLTGTSTLPGYYDVYSIRFTRFQEYVNFSVSDQKMSQYDTWAAFGHYLVRDQQTSPVPEPSTVILVFIGLISLIFYRVLHNKRINADGK